MITIDNAQRAVQRRIAKADNDRKKAEILVSMVDTRIVGELDFDNLYSLYEGLYGGYKERATVFVHPRMNSALKILTHMDSRYTVDFYEDGRLKVFGCAVETNSFIGKNLLYMGCWNEVVARWRIREMPRQYVSSQEDLPMGFAMSVLEVPEEHRGDTYSFYDRIHKKAHETQKEGLYV